MRVAIAGAGIGGVTLAALLAQFGHEVQVVEKAAAFGEVGAGIQISPNGARVLAEIGLGEPLDRIGTTPQRIVLRRWHDDHEILQRPLGSGPRQRYGFSYYNVYRPDLMSILVSSLDDVEVQFEAEVVAAKSQSDSAALVLADGTEIEADVVVGADGIHSGVRASGFGDQASRFSGLVAYRALVARADVADQAVEVTNRMGPDQHLVSYFVGTSGRCMTESRCRAG